MRKEKRRRLHRIMGATLAAQLLVWRVTGVLFNVKHRYNEAYETLAAPTVPVSSGTVSVSPAQALEALMPAEQEFLRDVPPSLMWGPRGAIYVLDHPEGCSRTVDAVTGKPVPPITVIAMAGPWP